VLLSKERQWAEEKTNRRLAIWGTPILPIDCYIRRLKLIKNSRRFYTHKLSRLRFFTTLLLLLGKCILIASNSSCCWTWTVCDKIFVPNLLIASYSLYPVGHTRNFVKDKMDQVMAFVEPGRQFAKDSLRLVKRCTKPDRKEFQKIAMATAIGFCIMGFIGFFVKLIHIPINNIIVGS